MKTKINNKIYIVFNDYQTMIAVMDDLKKAVYFGEQNCLVWFTILVWNKKKLNFEKRLSYGYTMRKCEWRKNKEKKYGSYGYSGLW